MAALEVAMDELWNSECVKKKVLVVISKNKREGEKNRKTKYNSLFWLNPKPAQIIGQHVGH